MAGWRLLLVAAAVLALSSCRSAGMVVSVSNHHGTDSVGVRIEASGSDGTWILRPAQTEVLISTPSRGQTTLELFDPVTCELLVAGMLPDAPGVIVGIDRGVTGAENWQFSAEPENEAGPVTLEPNFAGCR